MRLSMRIDHDLKNQLMLVARSEYQTLQGMIHVICREFLKQRQLLQEQQIARLRRKA
jgi:hypothetical protein